MSCRRRDTVQPVAKGVRLDEWVRRVVDLYPARSDKSLRQNSAARRLAPPGHEWELDFCLAEYAVPIVPRLEGCHLVGRG